MKKLLIISSLFIGMMTARAQDIPSWSLADLESKISNSDGPLILNFWATFCKPCIAEIPYFQELAKKYENSGVRLVLVSVDMAEFYPDKIKKFAASHKFTGPIAWLNETNADLFCPAVDKSWSGAIPATLMINNKTGFRRFFEEELTKEQLERQIIEMLAQGE